MTNETTKHENANVHGSYEHQDLRVPGIFYFLLTVVVATVICLLGIRGVYSYLERYEKRSQPEVNPLVTNVPSDTRHVAPGYPQSAFPSPKLEEDERGQLNNILMNEQKQLYSYGWVDEKSGIVRIPIDRAMDLIAQRGLPVRPPTGSGESSPAKPQSNQPANKSQSSAKVKK